eukprot:m.104724 g.104724  ORF g.104724 m.104724 type:complete len:1543 (+) comp12643_c0_seq3:38-4666(+)
MGDSSGSIACRRLLMLSVGLHAALLLLLLCSTTAVRHWSVQNDRIIEAEDIELFNSGKGFVAHLSPFSFFMERLGVQRDIARLIDYEMFGLDEDNKSSMAAYPDLLSKGKDYNASQEFDVDVFNLSVGPFLAHAGIRITSVLDLEKVKKKRGITSPVCDSTLPFSMTDFQHLQGVAERASLVLLPETSLTKYIWMEYNATSSVPPSFLSDFGAALGVKLALKQNQNNWALYFLSSLYWRIKGSAENAIECLRRSLFYSPTLFSHISLTSLANVLILTGYNDDAIAILDVAQSHNQNFYATFLLHGAALAKSGRLSESNIALDTAGVIKPSLKLAFDVQLPVLNELKKAVVVSRRDREINFRKNFMVLDWSLDWEDFEYETPENRCLHSVCPPHSECHSSDGRCHCEPGWLSVQGECVLDDLCEGISCMKNAICRAGKCYCQLGFRAMDRTCVVDKCAGVECVDNSVCSPHDGYCRCAVPFVFFGTECVKEDCIGFTCKENSFCQRGHCFCRIGYHVENDECVPDAPCQASRCPENSSCNENDGHCRCHDGFVPSLDAANCIPKESADDKMIASASSDAEHNDSNNNMTVKVSDFDVGVFDTHEDISVSLRPQLVIGVKPGLSSDAQHRVSEAVVDIDAAIESPDFDFNAAGFVDEHVCTRSMRFSPQWADFSSTFLPPNTGSITSLDSLVDLSLMTTMRTKPFCNPSEEQIAAAEHYLPSVLPQTDSGIEYVSEPGMQEIGTYLFDKEITIERFGTLVETAMAAHNDLWTVFDLATLYWRALAKFTEAFKCTQMSLALSPDSYKDVALINAANIFHRTKRIKAAQSAAQKAVDISTKYRSLCYFTLANAFAAEGDTNSAIANYKKTIYYHDSVFQLAVLSLKRMMCINAFPLKPIFKTATKLKSREQLRDQVKEAEALKGRLARLRVLVNNFKGDAETIKSLKAQLESAESRLLAVFVRQRLESQLSSHRQLFSSKQFHIFFNGESSPLTPLADFDSLLLDVVQEESEDSVSGKPIVGNGKNPTPPSLQPSLSPKRVDKVVKKQAAQTPMDLTSSSSSATKTSIGVKSIVDVSVPSSSSSSSSSSDGIDDGSFVWNKQRHKLRKMPSNRDFHSVYANTPPSFSVSVGTDVESVIVVSSETAMPRHSDSNKKMRSAAVTEIVQTPSLPSLMVFIKDSVMPECTAPSVIDEPGWPSSTYCSDLLGLTEDVLVHLERLTLEAAATSHTHIDGSSDNNNAHNNFHYSMEDDDEEEEEEEDYNEDYEDDDAGEEEDAEDEGVGSVYTELLGDATEETVKAFTSATQKLTEAMWEQLVDDSLILDMDYELLKSLVDENVKMPTKKDGTERRILPICKPFKASNSTVFDSIRGVHDRYSPNNRKAKAELHIVQMFSNLGASLSEFGTKMRVKMRGEKVPWMAYHGAAFYWRAVGNSSQAIECLRHAITVTPPQFHGNILLSLTQVLLRVGHYVDAIGTAETLVRLRPMQAMSHRMMANVLQALGAVVGEEAMYFYETSIHIDPSQKELQRKLAILRCASRYLNFNTQPI